MDFDTFFNESLIVCGNILVENQFYCYWAVTAQGVVWKCATYRKCSSKVLTSTNGDILKITPHNHWEIPTFEMSIPPLHQNGEDSSQKEIANIIAELEDCAPVDRGIKRKAEEQTNNVQRPMKRLKKGRHEESLTVQLTNALWESRIISELSGKVMQKIGQSRDTADAVVPSENARKETIRMKRFCKDHIDEIMENMKFDFENWTPIDKWISEELACDFM